MTEGLHFRKKVTQEDENEFLDEEEQEKLLKELSEQNDSANLSIQRGLVTVGFILLALFFHVLLQGDQNIIVPISQLYTPTTIKIQSPQIASACSILSILLSIITLILSSLLPVIPFAPIQTHEKNTLFGYAALVTAALPILQSIQSTWIELVFWSLPAFLIVMYYSAYTMIRQVNMGIMELEESKYKYKGA
ncbi:hypothetical protein EDC96DRAFT_576924 [Choanephora cucurbitarum]|nr:hypothetical protein EDC96DRAFT_576924 [Choanephora cucurbitarum]